MGRPCCCEELPCGQRSDSVTTVIGDYTIITQKVSTENLGGSAQFSIYLSFGPTGPASGIVWHGIRNSFGLAFDYATDSLSVVTLADDGTIDTTVASITATTAGLTGGWYALLRWTSDSEFTAAWFDTVNCGSIPANALKKLQDYIVVDEPGTSPTASIERDVYGYTTANGVTFSTAITCVGQANCYDDTLDLIPVKWRAETGEFTSAGMTNGALSFCASGHDCPWAFAQEADISDANIPGECNGAVTLQSECLILLHLFDYHSHATDVSWVVTADEFGTGLFQRVEYRLARSSFDPFCTNTLSLYSNTGDAICLNFPATIDIRPRA